MTSTHAPTDLSWLGKEAPRYTSYPTAHHFTALHGAEQHGEWIRSIAEDASVSVYVHIPFCNELCWFCGCHTKMTKRYEPIAKYVRVLLKEMETLKGMLAGRGKLVNIHFGGGSPSLLERGDLLAIMYGISAMFERTEQGEYAIELDPRTTTMENIALYADLGFNRASIGIQDFNAEVQQAINRIQPYSMVAKVVDGLREAGIAHINCDLIYGLPHQTQERFEETLIKTLSFEPERIALFSYAHVPQIKKHQRMIQTEWLPGEAEKLALYTMACRMLAEAGYVLIGIDHFAKASDPLAVAMVNRTMRRNFQGYVTDDTEVLLGLGCSSISQFPQGYMQNSAQIVEYRTKVEAGELATARGCAFVGEDIARKQVIDELMCFLEVDLAKIRAQFGLASGHFAAELATLTRGAFTDIVAVDGECIRITTALRMAARVVAAEFDQYRGVAAGRYSKVA